MKMLIQDQNSVLFVFSFGRFHDSFMIVTKRVDRLDSNLNFHKHTYRTLKPSELSYRIEVYLVVCIAFTIEL